MPVDIDSRQLKGGAEIADDTLLAKTADGNVKATALAEAYR